MSESGPGGGRRSFLLAAVVLVLSRETRGADGAPPRPGPRDLCPVCGMLVAKYPNWVAIVEHEDGRAWFFDGAKDLFKYLFDIPKYGRSGKSAGIARRWVTEFYGLRRIDAGKAFYVVGSDVMGPMGHELVPLASRVEAEEFLADHKGRRILTFTEVGRDLLDKIDAGRFDN